MTTPAQENVLVYHERGRRGGIVAAQCIVAGLALFIVLLLILNVRSPEVPRNDKIAIAAVFVPFAALLFWLTWTMGRFQTTVTPNQIIARTSIGRLLVIDRADVADIVPHSNLFGRWSVRLIRHSGRFVALEGIQRASKTDVEPAVAQVKEALGLGPPDQ